MADVEKRTFAEELAKEDRVDSVERHQRVLSYLFAAHGAGLVGCFSGLKDLANVKGVGFFIACFASGFLLTALAYFFRFVAFENARHARYAVEDEKLSTDVPIKLYIGFLFLSFVVLVFSLLAIIYRFHSL